MVTCRRLCAWMLVSMLGLAACSGGGDGPMSAALPTSTLAPLISLTPRFTATPLATRTPLPTFTPIPSETPVPPTPSDTPEPTATPPITGIIQSMQTVNIREGPGVSFSAFRALNPGTAVLVIGQNQDGSWFNIRMEDGEEGWVASALLFLEATITPFPTFTPTPDLTALALGTTLPTAVIGGGTVTPTPPLSAVTATPPGTVQPTADEAEADAEPTEPFLPIVDLAAIQQTSTALAALMRPVITPAVPAGQSPNNPPTQNPSTPPTPASPPPGSSTIQDGADVFAMCDNPVFGVPAPTDLASGSSVEVFWAWYVTDPALIDQHVEAVNYEVRLNDQLLSDWRQYGQRVVQVGNMWAKYWYVPVGRLEAGTYRVTYRATWNQVVNDGIANFGPGTSNPVEEGSCTFVVR
jgi:hypothetical protein